MKMVITVIAARTICPVTSLQSKWKPVDKDLIIESSGLADTQATTPILVLIVNPLGLNLHGGRKQDPARLRLYRAVLLFRVNIPIFMELWATIRWLLRTEAHYTVEEEHYKLFFLAE